MQRRTFIGALSAGALLMTTGSILKGADASAGEVAKNIIRRQPYYFTVADKKFRTGKGNVAFLGGSITEMDGYRPMVCEYLKKKYPQTQFNFIDAGVSSTCSNLGAFRVDEDVIQRCEGGEEAAAYEKYLRSFNDPGMLKMAHIAYGFNPGAKLTGNIVEDERVWGATEWGIGYVSNVDAPPCGQDAVSHSDGICLNSTVWLDDQCIMREGVIVDEELRALDPTV